MNAGTQPEGSSAAITQLNGTGQTDVVVIAAATIGVIDDGNPIVEFPSVAGKLTPSNVVGQFSSDTLQDIVYIDTNSNRVRWAQGDTFDINTSSGFYQDVGVRPLDVAKGDLDGDGDTDIVVANQGSHTVSILKNNNASMVSFSLVSMAALVSGTNGVNALQPSSVAVGDVDGDGDLDVVTANSDDLPGQSSVSLLLNDGTGVLTLATPLFPMEVPRKPIAVELADMNGDGALDIITSHAYTDNGNSYVSVALALP
jgi:hypothetical protein